MKRLAVLGASGHGKVVADIAECCGWDDIVFFDDAWPTVTTNGIWSVIGDSESLIKQLTEFNGIFIAIGNNKVRAAKTEELSAQSAPLITLVHPSAVISQYAVLGAGSVVMPNVTVNAFAHIGDGVILNTGCIIDHDCTVGNFVHISPGARLAGGVTVGVQSLLGIGCSVIQLVSVGSYAVVGAGAVVTCELPDYVKAVGVPARVL